VEQIGLEAILDTGAFDRGIASYLSSIKKIDHANESLAGRFGSAFDSMGAGVLKVAGLLSGALVAGAVAATAVMGS